MLAPHSAHRVETRRAEWARGSWSAQLRRSSDSVAAATPSQQRLRRSSDSVAAPSQQRCAQHQLRRSSISCVADAARRMSATELVCASPSQQRLRRSSDSVAAPSQQRCAHHERSTGQSKIVEQPVWRICQLWGKKGGTHMMTQPCFFNIILPKELRPLPCSGFFFFGF